MTAGGLPLAERFVRVVRTRGEIEEGDTVVVAVSGGVDSVVLLHLLHFAAGLPRLRLVVAHVDHAMRPGSAGDAAWLRGLSTAWGLEMHHDRLEPPPEAEADARHRRYAVLERVRAETGARLTLTAHHADDQAETVLFRILRGTGIRGLRGIRERRRPALWRPMLSFTRKEIEGYAEAVGLSWREDPTNLHPLARNVIRHRLLPQAEALVAPAARRALRGLARRAREDEEAWASLIPGLLDRVDARAEGVRGRPPGGEIEEAAPDAGDGAVSFDRAAFLALHPAVRTRLLRTLARRLGRPLGEAGTRSAVEFSSSGESGGVVPLGRGMALRRELERLVLSCSGPEPAAAADTPARIESPGRGDVAVRVGGATYRVRWSEAEAAGRGWREVFATASVDFPLEVRGWLPGDRARLSFGTKKLKKLFLEARVPPGRRHRIPVVVDATGAVLWVPDVVRSVDASPGEGEAVLTIRITHADLD